MIFFTYELNESLLVNRLECGFQSLRSIDTTSESKTIKIAAGTERQAKAERSETDQIPCNFFKIIEYFLD